jgi:nitrous oxide reductase accessory protein NosL
MLSVYHAPGTAVPAATAHIVVGSAAAGTMSPVSKVVFAEPDEARAFAAACGGEVVDYAGALAAAREKVATENRAIQEKRLASGKIVEPADADHCPVCNMFPARYPNGKCQARLRDGRILHFCSTQCLFAYLGRPDLYDDGPPEPLQIWVVDRSTGAWISAKAAFYAVGSSTAFGPMGHEAFPFDSRRDAEAFAAKHGGQAVPFGSVRIQDVVPGWEYRP